MHTLNKTNLDPVRPTVTVCHIQMFNYDSSETQGQQVAIQYKHYGETAAADVGYRVYSHALSFATTVHTDTTKTCFSRMSALLGFKGIMVRMRVQFGLNQLNCVSGYKVEESDLGGCTSN